MRPGKETHDLLWGDIGLKFDESNSSEYLEYTLDRQTKARTGINPRDVRKIKPRAYAIPNDPDKDPVKLYKLFLDKRPDGYNTLDSPFFLAVNSAVNIAEETKKWYKKGPIGINKMYNMMKEMKEKSGKVTDQKLTNHSMRKHLIQKINDSGIAPNQIVQISGHKNVNSLNNYSKINPEQCLEISRILSSTKPIPPSHTVTGPAQQSADSCDRNQLALPSSDSANGSSTRDLVHTQKKVFTQENHAPYQGLFSGNCTFHGAIHKFQWSD